MKSEQYFWELLKEYHANMDFDCRNPKTERHKQIEEELWLEYGCKKAVLVVDMSGFTILTQQQGIVHYLSMIERVKEITSDRVRMYGGIVVKFVGDNSITIFPEPLYAIRFAEVLNNTLNIGNVVTPDELDIYISCGIDFGNILMPTKNECFGSAVNRASKLAEDIAKPGQILVTQKAIDRLPELENIITIKQENTLEEKVKMTFYAVS